MVHVRQVLHRLLENQLFVKAEKCEFHTTETSFLGYILNTGNIQMDPAKTSAVTDWPSPSTRKELQRFLGFANFYRRFIRNYSAGAAPLTALTSQNVPFRWSAAAERAFCDLKSRFTSAPILIFPDPSRQFIVEVDLPRTPAWGPFFLSGRRRIRRCTRVPFSPRNCRRRRGTTTSGTGNC